METTALEDELLKTKPVVVTALPLSDEQLDEYFESIEDYMFFIDLDPTELDARSMLNYIYNSGMESDIKINEVTPENTEKLNALMLEYVKTDKLVYIPLLSDLWGSVCLHTMFTDLESPDAEVHAFVTQFIEKHKELADEVTEAVASLYFFLLSMMIDGDTKQNGFPRKKLAEGIGANLVNLRRSGNFWSFFMNINDYKGEIYNIENFEEFKYDGFTIAHYFLEEFSPFTSIVAMNQEE